MLAMKLRRDPTPSRWGYRYQRWMLSPVYRVLFRVGLPLVLTGLVTSIWLMNPDNRASVVAGYESVRDGIQQRPEFMVNALAVDGVEEDLADDVRKVLGLSLPLSSFDLNLEGLREKVEAVNAVESAILRIKPGGVLEVHIVARTPVAVWRGDQGLQMIDADGNFVAPLTARSDRADLPLIAGDGAEGHIDEAMELFAAAAPVWGRVRGLVRMGERRWDIVLDRDQRILLPEVEPVQALERVIVMAQTQDLLERDVSVIDLRHEGRPTIRLSEQAATEMRRINAAVSGTGN